MKVRMHPDMAADMEKMSAEERAEVGKMIGLFQQAATNLQSLPKGLSPAQVNAAFEAEVVRLAKEAGSEAEFGQVDPDDPDVPDEVLEQIAERMETLPTEH